MYFGVRRYDVEKGAKRVRGSYTSAWHVVPFRGKCSDGRSEYLSLSVTEQSPMLRSPPTNCEKLGYGRLTLRLKCFGRADEPIQNSSERYLRDTMFKNSYQESTQEKVEGGGKGAKVRLRRKRSSYPLYWWNSKSDTPRSRNRDLRAASLTSLRESEIGARPAERAKRSFQHCIVRLGGSKRYRPDSYDTVFGCRRYGVRLLNA